MTPEERAKLICDAENQICEENSFFVSSGTLDRMEVAIAAAIREAEAEALDRAARFIADRQNTTAMYADDLPDQIRALVGKAA